MHSATATHVLTLQPRLQALASGREKLLKWYKDTTGNDEDEKVISDKLGFEEWIRVCGRQVHTCT